MIEEISIYLVKGFSFGAFVCCTTTMVCVAKDRFECGSYGGLGGFFRFAICFAILGTLAIYMLKNTLEFLI